VRLFGSDAHQRLHFGGSQKAAMPGEVVIFLDDADGLIDAFLLAFDSDASIVQMSSYLQTVFQHSNVFV
jgi:hypothetical protein